MENNVDDPFALLIPYCQVSSSQEEKLLFCPFAGIEAPEPTIGIAMISPGNSSGDHQNPPEHHSCYQKSSSDGQVPRKTTDSGQKLKGIAGAREAGRSERKGQRSVNLAKDSDTIGLSKQSPIVLEDIDTVIGVNSDTDQIQTESGVDETLNENRVSDARENSVKDNAHQLFVEMPMREPEESLSNRKHDEKNIEDIDKFRYVGTKNKRKLPPSMELQEKCSGREETISRHSNFVDVLDHALKLSGGRAKGNATEDTTKDDDLGILEVAKRRGVTFPRPRWWPPEGF